MSKKTISITEGRKKLFKVAEEVQKPDSYYEFTVDGEPRVVLMSKDQFDSIMETMEILSNPKLTKEIKQAEKDIKKGDYIPWEEVKYNLKIKDSALIFRDRSSKKYTAKNKDGK